MMQGKYLITTDNRFIGPDGRNDYRAAWGDVKIVDDSFLGIKTNRNSSNWFAMVGTEDDHIIIAGCQIHYAIKCGKIPHYGDTTDYEVSNNKKSEYIRPGEIWISDYYKPSTLNLDDIIY